MTHPDRDLLLLAHGALSPVRAALVRLHVWGCPACRARLTQFSATSQGFAVALRPPHLPAWVPATLAVTVAPLVLWLVAALVLVGVIGTTLAVQSRPAPRASCGVHPTPPSAAPPCRPDLPNDKCR